MISIYVIYKLVSLTTMVSCIDYHCHFYILNSHKKDTKLNKIFRI